MGELSSACRSKIGSLDSARGIAALVVAAYHCGSLRWQDGDFLFKSYDHGYLFWGAISNIFATFCNGPAAVSFFFVLSGFVLALSASRTAVLDHNWAARFVLHRILRIYPAAIACLILLCWIYALTGMHLSTLSDAQAFAPHNILANFLLIHIDLNGVLWTLRLEVLAIPIVMLSIWLIRRRQFIGLVVLCFLLLSFGFSTYLRKLPYVGELRIEFLLSFIAGVVGFEFFRNRKWEISTSGSFWICIAAILVIVVTRNHVLGPLSKYNFLVESIAAIIIISCCAFGPSTTIQKVLELYWLKKFGEYSYSFYLLHPLTLLAVTHSAGWATKMGLADTMQVYGVPSVVVTTGLTLITTVAIFPLVVLSRRFIEVPCSRSSRSKTLERGLLA